MPIRASVPTIREGLISPRLKKAYREVLGELSKGVEDPAREIKLKGKEGIPAGVARLLKLYTLDVPGSFLKRGGQALESPDALTSEDLFRLAGETVLFGMAGAGTGVASIGRRPMPGFFSKLQQTLREVIREGTGKKVTGPVKKPGQQLLNILKKKGVGKEELEWTGVERMLVGGQKPIAVKDVMKQAIREEIGVRERKLLPWKKGEAYPDETTVGEFAQYGSEQYRRPFEISKDIPYEETVLALKRKPGQLRYKDVSHYAGIEDLTAWARTEIRPGSRGEKIRFIQEAQESAWGVTGRTRGFKINRTVEQQERLDFLKTNSRLRELTASEKIEVKLLTGVPPTPFKKDALKLMLKKELYEAAKDPSITHVGWTPGWMQAYERWPSPEAETKLLQLYDEIIPGFMRKQSARLGKGRKGMIEDVEVFSQPHQPIGIGRLEGKNLDLKIPARRERVPALKMDDWLREAILKGQRISKIDQAPFKEYLFG